LSWTQYRSPVLTSSVHFRRLIEWFACARLSEPHLPQSYTVTFPKRSPPWLLTSAALGGLKPAPASRLRRAYLHLLCSYAHFIKKRARGALYCMWLRWLKIEFYCYASEVPEKPKSYDCRTDPLQSRVLSRESVVISILEKGGRLKTNR
jgi:hypothetical protein